MTQQPRDEKAGSRLRSTPLLDAEGEYAGVSDKSAKRRSLVVLLIVRRWDRLSVRGRPTDARQSKASKVTFCGSTSVGSTFCVLICLLDNVDMWPFQMVSTVPNHEGKATVRCSSC